MKVKVKYCIDDGYINMRSNLIDNDIDLLELLASDISSKDNIERFNHCIFEDNDVWCSNLSEVKSINNKIVMLSSAFSLDNNIVPSVNIDSDILKKIIHDWKNFLKNKKEFSKIY